MKTLWLNVGFTSKTAYLNKIFLVTGSPSDSPGPQWLIQSEGARTAADTHRPVVGHYSSSVPSCASSVLSLGLCWRHRVLVASSQTASTSSAADWWLLPDRLSTVHSTRNHNIRFIKPHIQPAAPCDYTIWYDSGLFIDAIHISDDRRLDLVTMWHMHVINATPIYI